MATAREECCPICLETWDNVACTMPCLHRFCFSCIRRWTDIKPECPLCKRRVTSIQHSLWGDEFEELPITPPVAPMGSAQDEAAHLLAALAASRVHQPRTLESGFLGGLYAHTWGFVFREYPAVLQLLRPWLRQELQRIFGEERSQVLMLERMILSALPVCGLYEERLVEELQADLGSCTIPFVQGLIASTVERCERTAHHLLLRGNSHAARGLEQSPRATVGSTVFMRWRERGPMGSTSWAAYQERREGNRVARRSSAGFRGRGRRCVVTCTTWDVSREGQGWERSPMASSRSAASREGQEFSPMASTSPAASQLGSPAPGPAPSSSTASADTDDLLGTSAAALWGGPGCPLSVPAPTPGEQEEDLHRDLGQAAAAASAPRRDRGCSCQGPRNPLRRKASSSEDSAAPAKKPPRR